MLNEPQARAYAFGRKAAEPWGTYRLWTPAAEYRFCSWARFEAPASALSLAYWQSRRSTCGQSQKRSKRTGVALRHSKVASKLLC